MVNWTIILFVIVAELVFFGTVVGVLWYLIRKTVDLKEFVSKIGALEVKIDGINERLSLFDSAISAQNERLIVIETFMAANNEEFDSLLSVMHCNHSVAQKHL